MISVFPASGVRDLHRCATSSFRTRAGLTTSAKGGGTHPPLASDLAAVEAACMTAIDTARFGGQRITMHGEGSAAAASAHIVVVARSALALKVAAVTQCDKRWVVLVKHQRSNRQENSHTPAVEIRLDRFRPYD